MTTRNQIPSPLGDDFPILMTAFAEEHPEVASTHLWRYWIAKRQENGIEDSGALVQKGRRWYVVPSKFRLWLMAGNEQRLAS